jgi:hypothetical protein
MHCAGSGACTHIKWIFQELAAGRFTTESILKKAREKGLVCSKTNFWLAIRNPVYCGKIRVKAYKTEEEQLATGQHEPLISEALFYDVQDILDGRKKEQRTKITVDDRFPLRGFLNVRVAAGCLRPAPAKAARSTTIIITAPRNVACVIKLML